MRFKRLFPAFLAFFLGFGSAVWAEGNDDISRLIDEGMKHHNNKNFILAVRSFKRALDLDPKNKELKSNLAIVHNNFGKYLSERTDNQGALREFRHALYFDPSNEIARENLAIKLEKIDLDPRDTNTRVQEAQRERQAGNLYAAIAEVREANRIEESVNAYVEIGEINHVLFLKSGRQEKFAKDAIDNLKKARKLDRENIKAIVKLGDVYLAKNEINTAIDTYQEAVRIDPENSEAKEALVNGWLSAVRIAPQIASNHIGLATAYQIQGKFNQAERGFRKALEIDSNNKIAKEGLDSLREDRISTQINIHLGRALELQNKKQFDESLSEYIKALNLQPENPDIHYNIGTAFEAKEDFQRAKKAYSRTLELKPAHDEARDALDNLRRKESERAVTKGFEHAIKLQSQGKFQEAIKVYRAIAIDKPKDDTVFYNLGTAYQAAEDFDNAIAAYEKAFSLNADPNYKKAIDAIKLEKANRALAEGIRFQSEGDNQKAISNYTKVLDLYPENDNAWYNLGTAYQALDLKEKALEAYEEAYTIDPRNQSDAIFFAAIIQEEKRNLAKSIELYERYIKVAPKGQYAKDAKEREEYIKSFL